MLRYEHGGTTDTKLLDFSTNVNPLGLPESVKLALSEHFSDYSRYPDPTCKELKKELSRKLNITERQLLFGNGASELILAVCAALKPKMAMTLMPTFSEYERSVRLYGGSTCNSPESADFAFICNPNNPTGQMVGEGYILELLERGLTVVVDECFIDFTAATSMRYYIEQFPKLLVLNAFTKFYAMAGLRLGYLVGNPQLLEKISEYLPTWSVSAPAQIAGIAALSELNWRERTLEVITTERRYLAEQLKNLGLQVTPGEANFLLLKSDKPMFRMLKEFGVLVRDCSNFEGLDEHYFRIGVKLRRENERLIEAVKNVLNVLA